MLRAVPNESFGIYVSDFLSHTVISVFLMVCLHISLQNPTAYCHSNLHKSMIFDESDWRHQVTQTSSFIPNYWKDGRTDGQTDNHTDWMTTKKRLNVGQYINLYILPLLQKCTDITGLYAAFDRGQELYLNIDCYHNPCTDHQTVLFRLFTGWRKWVENMTL